MARKQQSLREVAKTIGVSHSYLSQVLNGKCPVSEKVALALRQNGLSIENGNKVVSKMVSNFKGRNGGQQDRESAFLASKKVVSLERFELSTHCLEGSCSILLSYRELTFKIYHAPPRRVKLRHAN